MKQSAINGITARCSQDITGRRIVGLTYLLTASVAVRRNVHHHLLPFLLDLGTHQMLSEKGTAAG